MSVKTDELDYELFQRTGRGFDGLGANLQYDLEERLRLGEEPEEVAKLLEIKE